MINVCLYFVFLTIFLSKIRNSLWPLPEAERLKSQKDLNLSRSSSLAIIQRNTNINTEKWSRLLALQFDCGGENQLLKNHLKRCNILHPISCSYTPPHSDTTERNPQQHPASFDIEPSLTFWSQVHTRLLG